jgi:YD repeat-containing protein
MKKKLKLFLGLFILFSSCFFGKNTHASETYAEEGTKFYAQTSSFGYASEGTAFYANIVQVADTLPVYRFYNTKNGDHFYTTSEDEKNTVSNNPDSGYVFEKIAFYAYSSQISETTPVYRFYNPTTGDHFYTISEDEKNVVINNPQWGYYFENIRFYVFKNQVSNSFPVYRFYNPTNGDHFYTASESEKENISRTPIYRFYNPKNGDHFYTASESERSIVKNTNRSGYLPEGIAFYAYNAQVVDSLPVYRFYNSKNGDHFYTIAEDEKNTVISNPQWGYIYEKIAFYAYASQLNNSSPIYRFYNSATGDHFYTASESERYALIVGPLGPEISVGLWGYEKADIQSSPFQIDANKPYNIRDGNGNIIAQVAGNSTTKVTYDADGNLKVTNSIADTLVANSVTFDSTDGDNTSIIFDIHRSKYVSDWRGTIDHYRGKIKAQYYHGTDIVGGTSSVVQQVWIINTLPLEQYTWGSAETSGTGNINHTQVMTTMVRTYGFWYIKYANKYAAYGFKIRSDSGSQNYGGYDWETAHPNVKLATQNTRGIIATYGNDVALTPYSSWSDGRTRSWQEKWGGTSYPWCQSVADPYGKNVAQSSGSHMVGLIANGSVNLAANYGWGWENILHYYYSNISLNANY